MICATCQRPLKPEEAERVEQFGASAAGITMEVHRERCALPPRARPRTWPDRS